MKIEEPVWLMQPIPYFGEKLKGEWIYEPKLDGWRMQILKCSDGEIKFFGRRLEKNPDWSEDLKYISERIKDDIPNGTILDCELYSDRGRRFIPSLFSKKPKAEPIINIFDIIYFGERFLGNVSLIKRKQILSKIKFEPPFYRIKFYFLKDIKKALKRFLEEGYEGIVIKKLNSPYKISKEGPIATEDWRKIKRY
jgi:ATP-dependent DNA ligase